MFKKVLDSITNKEEKKHAKNLLDELKLQEEKIQVALESKTSFITLSTLELRYTAIAKELNKLFGKYGIDERVKENHKIELEQAKQNFVYRDPYQLSEVSDIKDQSDETLDNSQKSPLAAHPDGTPLRSVAGKSIPSLKLDKLQIDTFTDGSFVASTPLAAKAESVRESNFPTPKHCLEYIKQELPKDIHPSYVESYLEDKNNFATLIETVKKGFNLPNIYQIVKDNIKRFIGQKEAEFLESDRDTTPLLSALGTFDIPFEENTVVKMSNTLDMRGLSVKDALDLIPRYNGANIPLTQFLDGCTEAQSILPEGVEENFMRFVRIRLYGEALNIARSKSFKSLKELADFFEKMFGSAKTYYDLTGELAKVRQGENESVVVYLNKLNDIEKEIRRTARKENRIKNEEAFTGELNNDCLKYFMRGLKWEIKACMGTPQSYQEAQERAIETERELICRLFDRGK